MATVWIPPQLQDVTDGAERVTVPGSTLRQVIDALEAAYPGIRGWLVDEAEGHLRPGLAAIIDGEASRLGPLERVREDSEIHFVPAMEGG